MAHWLRVSRMNAADAADSQGWKWHGLAKAEGETQDDHRSDQMNQDPFVLKVPSFRTRLLVFTHFPPNSFS